MFFRLISSMFILFIQQTNGQCQYLLNNNIHCRANQCDKVSDPFSIMVEPNNCKTSSLALAFSTYERFRSFRNNLKWKLGDFFSRKSNGDSRQLKIFIENIHGNNKPIDHQELNLLGKNIDLFSFYILNLTNDTSLSPFIHYDPKEPLWNIIQIRFICHSWMIYDEIPCPIHIIPPSFPLPQHRSSSVPLVSTTTNTSILPVSISNNNLHLILFISIPLFITLIISIYIFRRRFSTKELHEDSLEYTGDAQPYRVSQLPLPHEDSLYKEPPTRF